MFYNLTIHSNKPLTEDNADDLIDTLDGTFHSASIHPKRVEIDGAMAEPEGMDSAIHRMTKLARKRKARLWFELSWNSDLNLSFDKV